MMWKSRPAEIAKTLVVAAFAIAILAIQYGCASVPKKPIADPADTPLAVIGIFECSKMKGLLVVAKDGSIIPVEDDNPDDLKAFASKVGPDSLGELNLTDNCPPTQKTRT